MSAAVFGSGIPSQIPSICMIIFVLCVTAFVFLCIGVGVAALVFLYAHLKNCTVTEAQRVRDSDGKE